MLSLYRSKKGDNFSIAETASIRSEGQVYLRMQQRKAACRREIKNLATAKILDLADWQQAMSLKEAEVETQERFINASRGNLVHGADDRRANSLVGGDNCGYREF